MSKTEVLSVDLLRVDGDTQARVAVNQDVVDEYAEMLAPGKVWRFDQITVFHDGTDHWVSDGFHRTLAAIKAGRASVPCTVIAGTARDARIYGMTANDEHGLRMSREDRRKNVIWLLTAYPTMTQKEVAEKAGVSVRTVEYLVAEQKKSSEKSNPQIAGHPPKTRGKVEKTESKESASAEKKEAERAKKLADREAEKARKAAEKEAEKVRKAAEKEAEKSKKATEREAAKIAKEAERAAASEAAAKAKEEAKKAKRAARAKAREEAQDAARAELPASERVKMIRDQFNQYLGRMAKLISELYEIKPNRTAFDANRIAFGKLKLW